MIAVAVLVCGFAVGMAGLLNYFKYRSTETRLVRERLLVTGRAIESGVQSALALGLQFGDIGTLPGTLERERTTDDLILSIDVFDTGGRLLHSTDKLRAARPVPPSWLATAAKAGTADWFVEDGDDSAAGMNIENNFGLTVGYVALRYSYERLEQGMYGVGRRLALAALGSFVLAAGLASALLLAVMRRLDHDAAAAQAALCAGGAAAAAGAAASLPANGPFGAMLRRFSSTVRQAEDQIAEVRASLQSGGGA